MKPKLTVLGSGTGLSGYFAPFDYRNPAGHLLQTESTNILLDCGDGMRRRMNDIQFDFFELDAICITHFHPDHFNLESLIQAIFLRARESKIVKKLTIIGPPTIRALFVAIWDKKHTDGFFVKNLLKFVNITFIEYGENEKFRIGDTEISPYSVVHGPMDAWALRIVVSDKVVAYSGDCGECAGVEKAAAYADLFLCESAIEPGIDEEANTPVHLSPRLAGEIAQKAKVKKLALVHYLGGSTSNEMIVDVQKSGFEGKISVACDGDVFTI